MFVRPLLAAGALCACVVGVGYWQILHQAAARRLVAWEERQADLRLLARLERGVDADGRKLTLNDLADFVAEQADLDVGFDQSVLAEAGVLPESDTVRLPRGHLSLRALLNHTLSDLQLTFDVRHGQVLITTPEAAESLSAMYLVVYPLPQPNLTTRDSTAETWGELIETSIMMLVVLQTREIHEQIQALLDRLGSLDNPPNSWEPVHYPASDPNPIEQHILATLDKEFAFTFDTAGLPMDEFFTRLADEYEIPIVLDRRRLEEAGVPLDTPISVSLRGVPLRSAIRLVLNDMELTSMVRDDALLITTPEEAESCLTTMIYPVHDLVGTHQGMKCEPLLNLITATVSPQSWDEVGGPGSLQFIAGGWLIVSQTDEVHDELRSLLDLMRRALSEGGQRPYPSYQASPAERLAEAALVREIPVSYARTRLRDVAQDLTERLGVNVHLDVKRLEESGVQVDTPITCEFTAAPLRIQLERMLCPVELHFAIRADVLLITTPEECESRLDTCLYDVRPLIDDDLGILDDDLLIDLITSTIDAQSWDEVGGPGSIDIFRGLLVVSQFGDVHRQLTGLLDRLERHCLRRTPPSDADDGVRTTGARILPDPVEEHIEAALNSPLSLSLDRVPLAAAVDEIARRTGLLIAIDDRGLDNAGIPSGVKISQAASEQTVSGVLDRLLQPRGLAYGIWNRQIVISSREDCQSRRQTRLYGLADLLPGRSQSPEDDCGQLMDEVDSQYWDITGGPGSYFYINHGWVVVTADLERHLALADRLHELRTGQKTQRAREREHLETERAEDVCRIMKIPMDLALRLARREPIAEPFIGYPSPQMWESLIARRSGHSGRATHAIKLEAK